jgi:hypothetical protein
MRIELPATPAAGTMARTFAEHFLTEYTLLSALDVALAVWVVSELTSTAIDYSPIAGKALQVELACNEETFTAAVSGKDGVGLVARELADESIRSDALDIVAGLVDGWGYQLSEDEGDHVWVELKLGTSASLGRIDR